MDANEQQLQAINSNSNKLLVMAGAGAGKTFVMIQRVTRLVKAGVNPSSILVLTFTNNAAFEMRERYKKLNPGTIIPEFRTFHSFCYSLIVKDPLVREAIGYTSVPKVASDDELKFVEKDARMQTNFKIPEKKIKQGLNTLGEKKAYEIYKKALARLLKKKNLITFDILCYDICDLFVSNNPIVDRYKQQYQYLFVDEFQDTDPRQIQFLNSFKDVNWFYCGDALQNIYGFRGCTNDVLKLLSQDDSWERIKMYQNYRSTKEICTFANKHSRYADDSYRIEMNGQRNGDPVEVIPGSMADFEEPVDMVHLRKIVEMAKNRKEDMAIICRTNREVSAICSALNQEGIEYNASHKHSDAFHILRSVMDNEYMLNWLSTFLSADVYADYVRQSVNMVNPDISWFSRVYGKQKMIQKYGRKVVSIRKILQNIRMSDYEKCCQILEDLEIDSLEIEKDVQYNSRLQLIDDLIERLNNAASEDLYVGTIHSVKGLEFSHVIVVGAFDKFFKVDSEENKNIYYVAITRARDHLTVFMR